MISFADSSVLCSIRVKTEEVLIETIGTSKDVALLDFPLHQNAGDSLIWLGEIGYLKRIGKRIRYRADRARFSVDDLRRAMPDGGVVLFHGGGNFGDLWPHFQAFREDAIAKLYDYRVVVLSQSVHFSSESAAARANSALMLHPDLTLMIRDSDSLRRAGRLLPDIHAIFCHDMAFGWEPVAREREGRGEGGGVVFVGRTDHEKVIDEPLCDASWHRVDWGLSGRDKLAWITGRIPGVIYRRIRIRAVQYLLFPIVQRLMDWQAELNVKSAREVVERAEILVTDRLHAHLLACFLGIKNVVVDNGYGKIEAIYAEYSGDFSTSHLAGSVTEAEQVVGILR